MKIKEESYFMDEHPAIVELVELTKETKANPYWPIAKVVNAENTPAYNSISSIENRHYDKPAVVQPAKSDKTSWHILLIIKDWVLPQH